MNEILVRFAESPIRKKYLGRKTYSEKQYTKLRRTLRTNLFGLEEGTSLGTEEEWLRQLKEKFASASTRSEQVTILTLLPKSWSLRRVEREFSTTLHMARQARRLVEEKGIMTSPNPRQGRTLPAEVAEKVVQFYCNDEISRMMPGEKDFVTIREGGEKKQVQKRLILCSLKKAYSLFKKAEANLKIGF